MDRETPRWIEMDRDGSRWIEIAPRSGTAGTGRPDHRQSRGARNVCRRSPLRHPSASSSSARHAALLRRTASVGASGRVAAGCRVLFRALSRPSAPPARHVFLLLLQASPSLRATPVLISFLPFDFLILLQAGGAAFPSPPATPDAKHARTVWEGAEGSVAEEAPAFPTPLPPGALATKMMPAGLEAIDADYLPLLHTLPVSRGPDAENLPLSPPISPYLEALAASDFL